MPRKGYNRSPGGLCVELDELRRERAEQGRWPVEVDGHRFNTAHQGDEYCKAIGCLLRLREHLAPCRVCGELTEHHDERVCWESRSRMARARLFAGSEITPVDAYAIDRFPDPPSAFTRGCTVSEGIEAAMAADRARVDEHDVVAFGRWMSLWYLPTLEAVAS